MRYKLVCSNEKGSFTIRDDELDKALIGVKKGQPVIFNEGIVLNWNMYAGIVADKDRMAELAEQTRYKMKAEEPSPFGKMLAEKYKMIAEKKDV